MSVDGPTAKGQLLVATPLLDDPNFARTVILVLEHDDNGALGVVINRPSEMAVGDPLPNWALHAAEPDVVFFGGPVSRGGVIGLVQGALDDAPEMWQPVLDFGIGSVDLEHEPSEIGNLGPLRVFSGYAGWTGGQLEAEIDQGAWWVVDAHVEDAFDREPGRLWARVLRRSGGDLAKFALYPDDPSMN